MHTIRTLEDLFHAATNGLSLISSHVQYLQYTLAKDGTPSVGKEELEVIHDVAERTAALFTLLPAELLRTPIPATTLQIPDSVTRTETTPTGDDDEEGDQ